MNNEVRKRLKSWPAVQRTNAIIVNNLQSVKDAPSDRYVAFETKNFGWILSPKQANGFRSIYAKN